MAADGANGFARWVLAAAGSLAVAGVGGAVWQYGRSLAQEERIRTLEEGGPRFSRAEYDREEEKERESLYREIDDLKRRIEELEALHPRRLDQGQR